MTILLPSLRLPLKLLVCAVTAVFLAGCASEKTKPTAQRGWVGGEYALAKPAGFWRSFASTPGTVGDLPRSLQPTQKAAILVRELSTNTPAWNAGLRAGDFILGINQHPMTCWSDFRRAIDRSEPGTRLAVKAFREGKTVEYDVPVGRETFRAGGNFSVVFPTVVHQWDLWPNPGFSLVLLGYEPNPGMRQELGKKREIYDESWKAYLVFFEISYGDRVLFEGM